MFQRTTASNKLIELYKNSKTRFKIVQGGTWAGKTFNILPLLYSLCLQSKNREHLTVVAETIPVLKNGAIKDFKTVLELTNRWDDNKWNATDRKYTLQNGSVIEFTSYDNSNKAEHGKRTMLFLNEVDLIHREIVNTLITKTSGDVWMDFNPRNRFWVHEEYIDKQNCDFLLLTYKDNEACPTSIKEMLEHRLTLAETSNYWKNWCKVYIDGQIGTLEGAIMENYEIINKVPENASYNSTGLDFGFTNDVNAIVNVYKYNDGYVLDEVLYKNGLFNSDISNRLINKDCSKVFADSSAPKDIAELNTLSNKYKVYPVKKWKGSVEWRAREIQKTKFYITSNSVNIINEARSWVWDQDRYGETLNRPIDKNNHAMDAIGYALYPENKKSIGISIRV